MGMCGRRRKGKEGRREGMRKRKDNAEEMVVEEKKEAC
jgi:hypothetical protein